MILRDLTVLRKHLVEFVLRVLIQPFLLVFVFLYVFPKIGQSVGNSNGSGGSFATVLVPGVVGISIMFQGIQAVAMQLATEFGFTREIEDRVQAPCPVWLVAMSKVISGAVQGLIAAVIVFPIAAVVHSKGVSAHFHAHWLVILTLLPLCCVMFTALGLLLGTVFEPRNIGLMFGFVVLPITFLGGPIRGKGAGVFGACGPDSVATLASSPQENRIAALLALGIWPFAPESYGVSDVPGATTEAEAAALVKKRQLGLT